MSASTDPSGEANDPVQLQDGTNEDVPIQSNNEAQVAPEVAIVELVEETKLKALASDTQKSSEAALGASSNNGDGKTSASNNTALPQRKEAWVQVIEPAVDLSSSIFEFVPQPESNGGSTAADTTSATSSNVVQSSQLPAGPAAPVPSTTTTANLTRLVRKKKTVSFAPTTIGGTSDSHTLPVVASMDETGLQAALDRVRQTERSYVAPGDLPPFGWWDCFQLGVALSYTTMCLRRNISPRCLVLEDQPEAPDLLQQPQSRSLSATQMAVLARAGLAFNCSTQALVLRQAAPAAAASPSVDKKPKKQTKKVQRQNKRRFQKRRRSKLAILRDRLRRRRSRSAGTTYKWVGAVSKRLPVRSKAKLSRDAPSTAQSKPQLRRTPKLKLKLKLKLKFKTKRSGDDHANNHEKKTKKTKEWQEKGLNKRKIGTRGAIAVFQALRVNTMLLSLRLEHAAIDDSGMSALAAALSVNATLTQLSLAGNLIGPAGARDLADALEDSPDSMLLDLDLRDNRLGSQGALELGRALRENETLTRCDLSWNQLGPQTVLQLLAALRDNFVLRELRVYGRDLAGDGTQYLANLDYECAKGLAAALRCLNDSFAVIHLTGPRAALPVEKPQSSRWVQLPSRELLELDALVLARLIPRNSHLLTLDLHDNPGLGRYGVVALLLAIKRCPTLRNVNLANVGLFVDDGERVGELVAANSTLESLVMHEMALPVQQLRGNVRSGDIPESMAFVVASDHFLDRWVLAKCLSLNRITQELNGLRLPAAGSSRVTGIVAVAANERDHKELAALNLSGRVLALHEVAFLAKKMYHHLHLGRVALNSCGLDGDAACALAQGARNHATLHTLELENNPLGPVGGQALAECLAASNALRFLNLSWTQLGDDGAVGFREALARNTSIHRLDLRGNALRERGVVAVAEGLRRNATLCELHLRWNDVCPAGAEALAVALETNQSLRTLDIEHHAMGPRGAAAFAVMLQRNKHLEYLNMGGTDAETVDSGPAAVGIGSEQAQRIATALTTANRTLQSLYIGSNKLDVDAAVLFGELLKFNAALTVLDLSRSGLDAKRAPRFFACVSMNTTLQRLNLARNRIANEGLMACMRALEKNRTLRELNLAHNNITEEPLALLVGKLGAAKRSISPTLEWLCLSGNSMSTRTRAAFLALPPALIAMELEAEEQGEGPPDGEEGR